MAAERTTKTGIAISSVDENYTAPANATPEEATKARLAAAMREGVKREKARSLDTITKTAAIALQPVKEAHAQELDRLARTLGKAAHRDGLLQGIFTGIAVAVVLVTGVWLFLLKDIVMTNTAMQRINYARPPILENEHTGDTDYERVNPREPPSARP